MYLLIVVYYLRSPSPQPRLKSPTTHVVVSGPTAGDVSENVRTLQLALDELTAKYKVVHSRELAWSIICVEVLANLLFTDLYLLFCFL